MEAKEKKDLESIKNFGTIKEYSLFCFDYLFKVTNSKKLKNKKFLIKKVKDANTITNKSYKHLIIFSKLTGSFPLIIAEQYNVKNKLKDDVFYFFKNVPMMNINSFINLLEKEDIRLFHRHKPKFIEKPFFNEVEERLKKEFESLLKEMKINMDNLKEEILKIEKLVNYYFKNEEIFIKKISRFEKNKEKKIIEFSKDNNKKIVFLSNQHKKEIFEEEFFVVPSSKNEIEDLIKIKNLMEEYFS